MDAAVAMVYEIRTRPEENQYPEMIEAQWAKVSRALDAIVERWMGHLAGPIDISHVAVACALGYLDLRHEAREWRQGRDSLARWYESFAERQSMMATLPEK